MSRQLGAVVGLLVRAAPGGTAALGALVLARALLPVGYILSVGALVSAVARSAGEGSPAGVLRPMLVLGALVVAQELAEGAQEILAGALGRRLTRHTYATVLDAVLRLDIERMETPGVADRISLAQGIGPGMLPPGAAVPALAQLAASRLAGVACAVTLAQYVWWAPLPVAAAWLFTGRWLDREVRGAVSGFASDTPALRRASYFRDLGLTPGGAAELRVFGLGDWLVRRFSTAWLDGMREVLAHRQRSGALAGRVTVLAAAHLAVLTTIGLAAGTGGGPGSGLGGQLGVGELTVAVQALLGMATLGYLGDAQWTLTAATASLPHVAAIRSMAAEPTTGQPTAHPPDRPVTAGAARPRPAAPQPADGRPEHEIRFEQVSFRYRGNDRGVLDGLDLRLTAGRSHALVGANGAGKTTVLKLLAGLHEPHQGRITVDGVDLRELDPAGWRRRIAVVFQDFCRFELTLRDNIRYGAVHAPADDAAMVDALRLVGAEDLLERLPEGLDTVLSRQYTGGAELSGGQWQKVALARAMYAVHAGAGILVLDEPTAHLDIRAEVRLYERFLDLTGGITTILVSHRFGTVRLADRISVLSGGRVVESGSHGELHVAGGEYARMYAVQAGRYAHA